MEIPPEGRDHESERERLCLFQSHWGCWMVKYKKKKKKTRKEKTQEQELCNSFYPVNRHFSILPYPVTGFISGNFFQSLWELLRNPKDCEGTVKSGCRQKTLDEPLRDEKPMGERKARERSVVFPFLVFLPLPGFSTLFCRENSHTLESKAFHIPQV